MQRKVVNERTITKVSDELKVLSEEAYGILEKYLSDGRQFAVGNHVTIADFSILPTLNNLSVRNYSLSIPICSAVEWKVHD